MMDSKLPTSCPVCGCDLGFLPWHGDSASDEICPCCYIQFGYDDAFEPRKAVYDQWRKRWIEGGMKWLSTSRKPPTGWDPKQQLQRSGVGS